MNGSACLCSFKVSGVQQGKILGARLPTATPLTFIAVSLRRGHMFGILCLGKDIMYCGRLGQRWEEDE